ncbi:MAG: SoxR reducing system RseC family protein [Clostridia bacterium]|nr:SoxR reducing system RseC family protein [Clostridia bacterium]
MEQIGEIIEVSGNMARVRIKRASSCGENCAECKGCTSTSTTLDAINEVNAAAGNIVRLEMNSASFVLLSFIGYILPIVIMIAAYKITFSFSDNMIVSDAVAVAALLLTFGVFWWLDRIGVHPKRFSSRITRIIDE